MKLAIAGSLLTAALAVNAQTPSYTIEPIYPSSDGITTRTGGIVPSAVVPHTSTPTGSEDTGTIIQSSTLPSGVVTIETSLPSLSSTVISPTTSSPLSTSPPVSSVAMPNTPASGATIPSTRAAATNTPTNTPNAALFTIIKRDGLVVGIFAGLLFVLM